MPLPLQEEIAARKAAKSNKAAEAEYLKNMKGGGKGKKKKKGK